jgi:anti-anti-sigma factor
MADAAEPLLVVEVLREGNAAIVRIEGEVEFATAPRLRATLLDLAQRGASPVIIDLAGVSFLDSAGISLLVQAKNRLSSADSELVLRTPTSSVSRVLEISGVADLFRIER